MSDQRLTQQVHATIPTEMMNAARAKWPETAGLSNARVMRFVLAYALTDSREQAKYATQDTRVVTGYRRKTA